MVISNVLGVVALTCAVLGFGYRSVTYVLVARAYAREGRAKRGATLGLLFSGAVAIVVAACFAVMLFVPLSVVTWLAAVAVAGILIEEINTAFWRRKVSKSPGANAS
jgi:hypothetical protein